MAEQVVAKPPRPSNVTHRWSLYYFHSVTSFDKQPASAKKAWSRHTDSRQGTQTPAHNIDSWSSLQSPSQSWKHRSEHPSVTMMMNIMMSTTLENLFLALNLRNYSTSSLPWLSLQGGTIILIPINYIVDKMNWRYTFIHKNNWFYLLSKLLERIEECTEKTPAQEEVKQLRKIFVPNPNHKIAKEEPPSIVYGMNLAWFTIIKDFLLKSYGVQR